MFKGFIKVESSYKKTRMSKTYSGKTRQSMTGNFL